MAVAAAEEGRGFIVKKKGRTFFSEEKNQKTFMSALAAISGPWPPTVKLRRNKSLLLLFFRKEDLPSSFACPAHV
jgi:hypothetical protein